MSQCLDWVAWALEKAAKDIREAVPLHRATAAYITELEEEVKELRQFRDRAKVDCSCKPMKILVGAPGIEPGTSTMSRSKGRGKSRVKRRNRG